jgi:hypothetical protein
LKRARDISKGDAMNKEQIYDEQISPLMAEIIKICKEHKIAMLMNFRTPNDDDPDLYCTTFLLADEYEPGRTQLAAKRELMDERPITMVTTTGKDGSKTMTAFLD